MIRIDDRFPSDVEQLSDMEFRLVAQACVLSSLPQNEPIVLIGGTDLAIFSGLPRWSEDIDYKSDLSPRLLAQSVRELMPKIFPKMSVELRPQGKVLADKFNMHVLYAGRRTAFIPLNQVSLPSLSGRMEVRRVFGKSVRVFRETTEERIAEKLAAVPHRIYTPWVRSHKHDQHWRDLYDVSFLETHVDEKKVLEFYHRKGGNPADLQKLYSVMETQRRNVERVVSEELSGLLYYGDALVGSIAAALHVPRSWHRRFMRDRPEGKQRVR